MVMPHTHPGIPTKRPPQGAVARLARYTTWERPVFRPPDLSNWRVIFDPTPFRHQVLKRPGR